MTKRILVIEDNIYKTACLKNCAEAQFHLEVSLDESQNEQDLVEKVICSNADEIVMAQDSKIEEFIDNLKAQRATRLNTQICILLCPDMDAAAGRRLKEKVQRLAAEPKTARSKMRRLLRTAQPSSTHRKPAPEAVSEHAA